MKSVAESSSHDGYPVRTVARLTGLSPDLIRAWEKRYGVVSPHRGPRGARLYSADDIAHLRALVRVVESGRAIGDVATLDRNQLEALAGLGDAAHPAGSRGRHDAVPAEVPSILDRILDAVQRFDAQAVERELGDALVAYGSGAFARRVVSPLLEAVGERWHNGSLSVAQEHVVSGVLRNLLTSLIRGRGSPAGASVLLATPSGDRHEFGLLLVALTLLDAGRGVVYLGIDVPAADVVAAARATRAAVVGLGVVDGGNRGRAVEEVRAVEHGLPGSVEIWLGGREAVAVAAQLHGHRTRVVVNLDQLEAESARLGASVAAASH